MQSSQSSTSQPIASYPAAPVRLGPNHSISNLLDPNQVHHVQTLKNQQQGHGININAFDSMG